VQNDAVPTRHEDERRCRVSYKSVNPFTNEVLMEFASHTDGQMKKFSA